MLRSVAHSFFLLLVLLSPTSAPAPESAASEIRAVLDAQVSAWNRGDITSFMSGYWHSNETEFIGSAGITRGWQAVHDRYRRNYPDARAMGRLSFGNLEIHATCSDAGYVIGEYHLIREPASPTSQASLAGDLEALHASGVFTLNFKKFPEGWRIVADHTSAYPAPEPPN